MGRERWEKAHRTSAARFRRGAIARAGINGSHSKTVVFFFGTARGKVRHRTRTIVLICEPVWIRVGSKNCFARNNRGFGCPQRDDLAPQSKLFIVKQLRAHRFGGAGADFRPNPQEPEAESVDDPLPKLFHVKQFRILTSKRRARRPLPPSPVVYRETIQEVSRPIIGSSSCRPTTAVAILSWWTSHSCFSRNNSGAASRATPPVRTAHFPLLRVWWRHGDHSSEFVDFVAD